MSTSFVPRIVNRPFSQRAAFTLVELLVVIGIIALLISILLPALSSARENSRCVSCQSNVHQLCQSLVMYANDNRGRFPQNISTPSPGQYWYQDVRVGRTTAAPVILNLSTSTGGDLAGGVFTCPSDDDGLRSYAMNFWASSKADSPNPAFGVQWAVNVPNASKMILVAEKWSSVTAAGGYTAKPVLGKSCSPGARFGAGAGLVGLSPPSTETRGNVPVTSDLPFQRHRKGSAGVGTEPKGRVNIGYADGHAATKAECDLVDSAGLSTLDSLWSPMDSDINN